MLTVKKFILILTLLFWPLQYCLATPVAHGKISAPKNIAKHSTHKNINHSKSKSRQPVQSKRSGKKIKTAPPKKVRPPQIRSEQDVENSLSEHDMGERTSPTRQLVSSIEERIVSFVQKSVETLRYSAYKLGGTKFDASHGIYVVDCSSYVDNVLRSVHPNAFSSLVNSTGADKPNSQHYYEFFSALPEEPKRYWNKVDEIEALHPGDILVFRYKNTRGAETGGHVMVVMEKPVRTAEAFLVSVADSAPVGHSQDTRQRQYSGIGIGTLLLKMDPKTGQPAAYAWKVGSRWNKNVNFAMARPTDLEFENRKRWLH